MKAAWDFAIVGAGPAGCEAALCASRRGLDVLLIGNEPPGGLAAAARKIENLAGSPRPLSGRNYQRMLQIRVERARIRRLEDTVLDCRREDGRFLIMAAGAGALDCRALLLACGTEPAAVAIPGLDEAAESGLIHRDIRTLPRDLESRRVLVVGGGEAAVDSALSILERGGDPVLCVRGDRLAARRGLVDELKHESIAVLFGLEPAAVNASGDGMTVDATGPEGRLRLKSDFLLLCVGRRPRLALYRRLAGRGAPRGVITGIPGLFLAGDVLRDRNRYIPPAMADGIRAAVEAGRSLAGDPKEIRV